MAHLEELHQVTGAGSTSTAGGHDDDEHQEQQQLTVVVHGGDGKKEKKEKEKHEVVPELRFPPGFRFALTDMELLEVFLRGKIDGRKLPLEVIFFEVPILNWEPHKLVEARKACGVDRWYFFTKWESSPTNKAGEPRRKLHDVVGVPASWKATGRTQEFSRGPAPGQLVGTRKLLSYYVGGDVHKWTMHEYVLGDKAQMDQFVLCTIQEKKHTDANGKRRERISDGSNKETPKRKKKTPATTSQQQPDQSLEHGQHLMTPLPLLEHEQYHHQLALQEEHIVDAGKLVYDDDGLGEPPLMMPQQYVYQASIEEMKLQATYGLNQSTLPFNYHQYTSELHQLNAMDPVYALDNQGQQPMWDDDYAGQISSLVNTDDQLCQQPTITQGSYKQSGTSDETSPDSVFEGPESLSYAAPGGGNANGGGDLVFLVNGDLNNYCVGDDNLVGNNGGNDAAMALPDEGKQALPMCQHGDEWRQRVGIIWFCFLCGN